MLIRLEAVEAFERPVRLRLPFRFGIIVLREAPQVFLRVTISDSSGRRGQGIAAEMLAPKWYDKNPELSNEQNFDQLRRSIRIISDLYLQERRYRPPFELSLDAYASQLQQGAAVGLNPLASSFGPALADRAILDAACRLEGTSFWDAIQGNLPGFAPHFEVGDLDDVRWDEHLSSLKPVQSVEARHTVGLVDPITADDQASGERVADGLPETLEEVVEAYGHRYFKIKVTGQEEDLRRLELIAAVLDEIRKYYITLDGNEQFKSTRQVVDFTRRLAAHRPLRRFWKSVLFLEQPLDRGVAWDSPLQGADLGKPVIVDESDGTLDAFVRARELGYQGVSSKACKGFYKSILNQARCMRWNQEAGSAAFFMSGEDLTTQAGVAVQQDLALVALLGLGHVERNGHHYVRGFDGVPPQEPDQFLLAHPGLYRRVGETVCLDIREGRLDLRSLGGPGFGCCARPDFDSMEAAMRIERG